MEELHTRRKARGTRPQRCAAVELGRESEPRDASEELELESEEEPDPPDEDDDEDDDEEDEDDDDEEDEDALELADAERPPRRERDLFAFPSCPACVPDFARKWT